MSLIDDPPVIWTIDLEGRHKSLTTWGVFCTDHNCWVARGPWTEREAWQAMLAVDTTHPMRLEVRAYNEQGPTQDEDWVECPDCRGATTCFHCDQTCPRCQGTGEIERTDLGRAA